MRHFTMETVMGTDTATAAVEAVEEATSRTKPIGHPRPAAGNMTNQIHSPRTWIPNLELRPELGPAVAAHGADRIQGLVTATGTEMTDTATATAKADMVNGPTTGAQAVHRAPVAPSAIATTPTAGIKAKGFIIATAAATVGPEAGRRATAAAMIHDTETGTGGVDSNQKGKERRKEMEIDPKGY